MSSQHPYYHRPARSPNRPSTAFTSCGDHVDLANAHLPAYEHDASPAKAQALLDARSAAAVRAAVALDGCGDNGPLRIWPAVAWDDDDDAKTPWFWERDLLELKFYDGDAPTIYLPTAKCLATLAYLDFFPDQRRLGHGLRTMVSAALLAASPGWCGSFGPDVEGTFDVLGGPAEGNYDMTQMHLLTIAYLYADEVSPEAQERLITLLLARGRIQRPNRDDTFTSGSAPNDWARAGYISPLGAHKDIGETENHILMIATARYLTNQLLFQRDRSNDHDNRRNSGGDWPSCTAILVSLLRDILRDDFSEYNAKPYQEETRFALLNLCSFAYDHEVRIAARMVLDYISAHVAVSTNDLRRMVPFRRRNEGDNVRQDGGHMTVGLIDGQPGEDPMSPYFAIQAGNTRSYGSGHPWKWGINGDDGSHLALEFLSEYRLPTSVHDLFVNDLHRRFFQRLHRTERSDEEGGNRNADNMEIYASSPSYLITAGGSPSGYAVDPDFAGIAVGKVGQELGVALTTSFMPTGFPDDTAAGLIQFSAFTEGPDPARNYGVAPDFACGHNLYLPSWVQDASPDQEGAWMFVNRGQPFSEHPGPGFYLAVYQSGPLALLEAFDTWLHNDVTFEDFKRGVLARNGALQVQENQEFSYTTSNGNMLFVTIWSQTLDDDSPWPDSPFGAVVRRIEYGDLDPTDQLGDAGNVTDRFLNGTVLNSPAEAVVEITNPFLNTKITLDMGDPWHPRRVSETGEIEEAGSNHEVWLDFDWTGPSEGDVCRPFQTLHAATTAVAAGGVVRIVPGATTDRSTIDGSKPLRLVAPIGGVVIGADQGEPNPPVNGGPQAEAGDPVGASDVWVQFDFPPSSAGNVTGPFNSLLAATAAVADGGTVRIVPGESPDRSSIGNGKRFTISAPIGGVTIGAEPGVQRPPPRDVWVNFGWQGSTDGGICCPFTTMAAAVAAVADGGVVWVFPGSSNDRAPIGGAKRFTIAATSGDVAIGQRP